MWFEVVRDLPQGLPAPGDLGLDHTHTWGRTYWGGALYCFLADIQIHKLTQNKKGLDDALRAILDAGGDIRYNWDLDKALEVGDKSTGVAVLKPLYDQMKNQPHPVDLYALWKELGVERTGDTVHFQGDAPLAATLKSMTNGNSTSSATQALNLGRNSRP
jgi:predicted metalloprotease with PDZ domain